MQNPLSPTKLELIDCYSQAVVYLTGCGSDPLNGVQYGRDLGLKQMNTVFGIQHWFYKTCRLQVQYTHANPAKGKHFGYLQTQVQVAF